MKERSIAIVGSFKQHNRLVQEACAAFRSAGIRVTSPLGQELLMDGLDFVRFDSDNATWSDSAIQSLALHRILGADLVYVVAPAGYIGKTTCYEVGRIVQRRQPLYFSSQPLDLPLSVPESFILEQNALLQCLKDEHWQPTWLFASNTDLVSTLERGLIEGKLRDE